MEFLTNLIFFSLLVHAVATQYESLTKYDMGKVEVNDIWNDTYGYVITKNG